jgi:hypothetical protein
MTNRENQKRLDKFAMRYLTAIDAGDFDTLSDLWARAADDPDLCEMLHELNATLATEDREAATNAVVAAIEQHMPSAEVVRPAVGPLTVAEVADHIRKNPPPGLTTDDLRINDILRGSAQVVPAELGISQVVAWGRQFGSAPEPYWRAFREVALDLWMRRTSADNYQMAARPQRPNPPGDKS